MLPSSGIIVFLRTLWLVSAHEIAESDPGSSPSFGKIFSVRSWLRLQIGSLFSGRNGHSYRAKVQTLASLSSRGNKAFATDTAEATGQSKRNIKRSTARADKIGPTFSASSPAPPSTRSPACPS
jgi:hypothetical protein